MRDGGESVSWLAAIIPFAFPFSEENSGILKGPNRSQWRVRTGFSPVSRHSPPSAHREIFR